MRAINKQESSVFHVTIPCKLCNRDAALLFCACAVVTYWSVATCCINDLVVSKRVIGASLAGTLATV